MSRISSFSSKRGGKLLVSVPPGVAIRLMSKAEEDEPEPLDLKRKALIELRRSEAELPLLRSSSEGEEERPSWLVQPDA